MQLIILFFYFKIFYFLSHVFHCNVSCVNYDPKKRILLRSDSLSASQVSRLAEKHGFKLWNTIERYDNGYILIPKKMKTSPTNKRDFIPNIDGLKFEPMVSEVSIENWEIRDPRGIMESQSFSSQISENTVINIRDPVFNKQWYLLKSGMLPSQFNMDINILPVWDRGIDGTGVTIGILDDGIDYTNADIYSNYDRYASYDYQDMDEDPSPPADQESSHGTRCASIIAGSSNNFCGIGVAYNASIAGIRMLDNKTTDSIEADALSHKSDRIDIYSCNWGPRDDGTRFGGPGPLATKALHAGAQKGRNKLGSIYIWSSGNGGLDGDNCNADGYVTNLYTLAIGAITAAGKVPLHAETCSSVMATTFSGSIGIENLNNIMINSDIGNQCKQNFQGTSSAGSIATGVVALMLQANPSLSWRDVHHIIVETAQIVNPGDGEWKRNGAEKWFNPKYGFGRLDALEMIQTAYKWKNVDSKQSKCKIPYIKNTKHRLHLYKGGTLMINVNATNCYSKGKGRETNTTLNKIKKIEHVQLIVTLSHECRGRMNLVLISPSGTMSPIMLPRPQDKSTKGLQEWIFKSVHFWGESPEGQWTLVFSDSTNVDPCNLNNQTLNTTTNTNLTDTQLKNNILSNSSKITNATSNNNGTFNASLAVDSINIGNTTGLPRDTNASAEGNAEQPDIKNLYNIINNINDISQKILKLQSNNNSAEAEVVKPISSQNAPASTKSLGDDDNEANNQYHEKDDLYNEKFRKMDTSKNNDTKYYERLLLEKVRVGPNSDKGFPLNTSVIKEYKSNGNNDEETATSLNSNNNEDDDEEVSGTNEEKFNPKRNVGDAFKNIYSKKEDNIRRTYNGKIKRSKQFTPHKNENLELKRSRIKNSSKPPKVHTEKIKIVGDFEAMTLIIYGT